MARGKHNPLANKAPRKAFYTYQSTLERTLTQFSGRAVLLNNDANKTAALELFEKLHQDHLAQLNSQQAIVVDNETRLKIEQSKKSRLTYDASNAEQRYRTKKRSQRYGHTAYGVSSARSAAERAQHDKLVNERQINTYQRQLTDASRQVELLAEQTPRLEELVKELQAFLRPPAQ
jgi:hypothetical protein